MPTLPLYNPTIPDADGWHEMTSPGGYEWWYFDVEDPSHNIQLVAVLHDGAAFHPQYIRAFERYVKTPTMCEPPLPREYRCAYLGVYENQKLIAQFMSRHPTADFSATPGKLDVSIGTNSIQRDDGVIRLHMDGEPVQSGFFGPRVLHEHRLSANLQFKPRWKHKPMERVFFTRRLSGAEHRWVLSDPFCDVTGEIKLDDRTIAISGRGYHDHNFGTSIIGPGLRRWLWGRVLLENSVATFHIANPRQPTLPNEIHLVQADATAFTEHTITRTTGQWDCRSGWRLKYPSELSLGKEFRLHHPVLLDSTPFFLRLNFQAELFGEKGTALCEITYPHRLRSALFRRWISGSIRDVRDDSAS